jgi:hypothetical protein
MEQMHPVQQVRFAFDRSCGIVMGDDEVVVLG